MVLVQNKIIIWYVQREFSEIIDLLEPDDTPINARETLRIEGEDSAFSSDHYLADYMQEEVIQSYLDYVPPWHTLTPHQGECFQIKTFYVS